MNWLCFSETSRQRAFERFELLRAHLEDSGSLAAIAREARLSYRTLEYWLERYRTSGVVALARKTCSALSVRNSCTKPMIGCRIVLAGMLSMLTCFGCGGEPLKIGMVAPVTGSLAETGLYQIQGAKLAVEEINKAGGVLGRPIELVIEDSQSTNPGSVLAFSKLTGDKDIPAFIGPIFSTQIQAMAPDIQRTGRPVIIGATDPRLTHVGYTWLFRSLDSTAINRAFKST
jgi:ABC-type branched-subunit amino acid transport system substrate-binding protein